MPKEIFFRHEQPMLNTMPFEDAVYEAYAEYPRVISGQLLTIDLGVIRLIRTAGKDSQAKALSNFELLSGTELKHILPAFVYPLNISLNDAPLLVINEFAPDDSYVAVRTIGKSHNIYTGNTGILDEAELYFRQHGMIDEEEHGTIADLAAQAVKIAQILSTHSLTARMSAFSVVMRKTHNQQGPFQAELKLRDLSQVIQQAGPLIGHPIWGTECLWGMLNTVLWFHKR